MADAVAAETVAHRSAQRSLRVAVDHDAGRDRVAPDPALAVRGRDVPRERDEPGLGYAVGREGVAAVERGGRRGVDDRATAAFQQRGNREATAEHRAGEVHAE